MLFFAVNMTSKIAILNAESQVIRLLEMKNCELTGMLLFFHAFMHGVLKKLLNYPGEGVCHQNGGMHGCL